MKSIKYNTVYNLPIRMALLSVLATLLCGQALASEESRPHGLTNIWGQSKNPI